MWFMSMITYCPQNFTRQAGVYISNFYLPDDKFTRHWQAGECSFRTLNTDASSADVASSIG